MESLKGRLAKVSRKGSGPTPPHLLGGPKIHAIPAYALIAGLWSLARGIAGE